ncbi:MAG: isoprenylcysteine carboxylmethyltransferase family protein [Deltaproteobacteria bacterium]
MNPKKTALVSLILLYFVICLEILIMISPFAGFFYAVFNPVLVRLAGHPTTNWLTAFFMPHMVLPSSLLLIAIRVAGSVFIIGGLLLFLICAVQIYSAKFRQKGAVTGGVYRFIRHPQYLALAVAGIGLAILWPRFLNVALWCCMTLLYYLLARDEERRVLKDYADTYGPYMERTGMFLPRAMERFLFPASGVGRFLTFVLLCGLALGATFWLRWYTVHHLTLWQQGRVTAIAILPEDGVKMEHRMADILAMEPVAARLKDNVRYLVYVMPQDYVMQGMIADTGDNWRLYKHHHTLAMIVDWIFHPFRHLRAGHMAMAGHHPDMMRHAMPGAAAGATGGVVRRLIWLKLENLPLSGDAYGAFGMDVVRKPVFMADVEFHRLQLLAVKDLPSDITGWNHVPTPVF